MHNHVFSEAQGKHALEVVLKLMRERRYFLYQHEKSWVENPGYDLNPEIFSEALELDKGIRAIYADVTQRAEDEIRTAEQNLGVAKPDLSGNKKVVQGSRYTGGLDICDVYPLTAFLEFVPATLDKLGESLFRDSMGTKSEDDFSPKAVLSMRTHAQEIASTIWTQFEAMEIRNPDNPRCVVLLKTRFYPSGSLDGDFMEGKVLDLQKYPHALGYLFYRYSKRRRIVRHDHVVFSTSRSSHVNVQHWSGKERPSIDYEAQAGYDCQVHFVTVL